MICYIDLQNVTRFRGVLDQLWSPRVYLKYLNNYLKTDFYVFKFTEKYFVCIIKLKMALTKKKNDYKK